MAVSHPQGTRRDNSVVRGINYLITPNQGQGALIAFESNFYESKIKLRNEIYPKWFDIKNYKKLANVIIDPTRWQFEAGRNISRYVLSGLLFAIWYKPDNAAAVHEGIYSVFFSSIILSFYSSKRH